MQLPLEDKYTYKRGYVEAQLAILMGGRVAEELTQEDVTTGAGNDIERATELARRMVREWGMSDLGPLSYGGKDEPVFLGRDFAQRADYSEDTAIRIDREVERIVQAAYQQAQRVLTEERATLERLAVDLLEQESLDGRRVYEIIAEVTGRDVAPSRPQPPAVEAEPPPAPVARPSAAEPDGPEILPEPQVAAAPRRLHQPGRPPAG
jgi:cell division protease FtsH